MLTVSGLVLCCNKSCTFISKQPKITENQTVMKQMFIIVRGVFTLFFIVLILSSCTQNEWPQFLGPDSNMVITAKDLPEEWNDSLNIRWAIDMDGESWSSPIVLGDKIFISSALLVKKAERPEKAEEPAAAAPPRAEGVNNNTPPPPPPADDKSYLEDVYRWQITCVDAQSGKELWKKISFEGNPRIKKHAGSTYACETPVSDGKYIYVYYGMVGVYCYDLDGNLIWEKDLGAYETVNGWGTGSSPVLHNGLLYVVVDNEESSFMVALETQTGNEKWRINRDENTNYGTPVIWKNTTGTELVVMGKTVRSYNPESGQLIWQLEAGGNYAIPSPVYNSEHIYLGNAGGPRETTTLFAVKAGASGDITPAEGQTTSEGVVWSNPETGISNPSPVLFNGLIYVVASRGGEVTCIDAANGELKYKEKISKVGAVWASPWIYNNKLYFMDEKGVSRVLKTGSEFEVLGENAIDDKFWASVIPTSNAYVFKGVEKLYCVAK